MDFVETEHKYIDFLSFGKNPSISTAVWDFHGKKVHFVFEDLLSFDVFIWYNPP